MGKCPHGTRARTRAVARALAASGTPATCSTLPLADFDFDRKRHASPAHVVSPPPPLHTTTTADQRSDSDSWGLTWLVELGRWLVGWYHGTRYGYLGFECACHTWSGPARWLPACWCAGGAAPPAQHPRGLGRAAVRVPQSSSALARSARSGRQCAQPCGCRERDERGRQRARPD